MGPTRNRGPTTHSPEMARNWCGTSMQVPEDVWGWWGMQVLGAPTDFPLPSWAEGEWKNAQKLPRTRDTAEIWDFKNSSLYFPSLSLSLLSFTSFNRYVLNTNYAPCPVLVQQRTEQIMSLPWGMYITVQRTNKNQTNV